jgi:hypothetical protein
MNCLLEKMDDNSIHIFDFYFTKMIIKISEIDKIRVILVKSISIN